MQTKNKLTEMNEKIPMDELTKQVNYRYQSLLDASATDPIEKIKEEFDLPTSVVWELIGLKDELDFGEIKVKND